MRPKIGIALGSGAARGWSHIGILEALNRLGIQPDIVCGTSIGALVGAAYVTDRMDALRKRLEEFDRLDVAALLDVKLTSGGLIEGKRIENFLDSLGITGAIEKLACRYGAVATDLASGIEVWRQTGPIEHAVRASIGMPGIFSPTSSPDGRWLVDGGLVNPVPVSLARALGADVVIAVDLNSELLGRRFVSREGEPPSAWPELPVEAPSWLKKATAPLVARVFEAVPDYPSLFEVLANSLNIMQDRITRARLAGDPPDVILRPRMREFDWMDFHRAKEAIARGVACVDAAAATIEYACGTPAARRPGA